MPVETLEKRFRRHLLDRHAVRRPRRGSRLHVVGIEQEDALGRNAGRRQDRCNMLQANDLNSTLSSGRAANSLLCRLVPLDRRGGQLQEPTGAGVIRQHRCDTEPARDNKLVVVLVVGARLCCRNPPRDGDAQGAAWGSGSRVAPSADSAGRRAQNHAERSLRECATMQRIGSRQSRQEKRSCFQRYGRHFVGTCNEPLKRFYKIGVRPHTDISRCRPAE